ncbi:DNA polymerase zeta catalytic subunit [Lachnellula subtilissima]|uniref:DNA polymerase n=1 Tax=Lachnellula subtilissima TaxID=602034 RepID=A0A8H8RYP2_9HELO|nr:DNA polymerase zeta catalytic subunit [Lachnellula subtilissima]
MDLFRVRLNCIDNYQATPTKFDPVLRNNVKPSQVQKEPKVPVIRVFGATETGQKVCAHIHGAFPYLYIEYTGSLAPDDVGAYIHRLHLSVDFALAVSYRRNMYDGNAKYVARVTLVKGIPFYGYHVGYSYYLKIYMLNPMTMIRLGDLLRQGVIMKKVIQPYEAHLQYLLQWMADYNLYGCGYIDCSKATFRSPLPKYEEMTNPSHLWHDRSIPKELVTEESELPRVSHCSIEVDICVQDILNRNEIKVRPLHHDFIERLNPLAPDQKLVHSMAGLWRDETRRRKAHMSNPDPGSSPFPPEVMISMSADPRHSQPGGWIHEEEYREKIKFQIAEEKSKSDGATISFDTFVRPAPFDSSVRTCLEGVEDLYPENLRPALGLTPGARKGVGDYDMDDEDEEREVDEKRILAFNMENDDNDFLYDSDEDIMREIELSQKKKGNQVEEHPESENTRKIEHEINDESRLGGDHYAEQYVDPADPNSWQSSSGPSEGAVAGPSENASITPPITTSSQYDDSPESEEVSQPVPAIEVVPQPTANTKRSDYPVQLAESPAKRQKMQSGQYDEPKLHHNNSEAASGPYYSFGGENQLLAVPNINDGKGSRGNKTPKLRAATVNGSSKLTRSSDNAKSSQESLKANDRPSTQPLNFPIVKDPYDPYTILRLSQKSASQPSPVEQKKHVSFDPLLLSPQSPLKRSASLRSSAQHASSEQSTKIAKVLNGIRFDFGEVPKGKLLAFAELPPSYQFVDSTIQDLNLPSVIYQDAYYSNEQDVPDRAREWAGREFKLESLTVPFLPEFDPTGTSEASFGQKPSIIPDKVQDDKDYRRQRRECSLRSWAIVEPPPTYAEVNQWCKDQEKSRRLKAKLFTTSKAAPSPRKGKLSQIDGPTQNYKHGFKYTQNQKTTSVKHEVQYMSTMSLEVHVNTRGNLVPNPEEDEVQCIFWCLQSDDETLKNNGYAEGTHLGMVILSEDGDMTERISKQVAIEVLQEQSELDLMIRMVELVRAHDPDILTGYEVHGSSWGFLIERARLKYDYNLCDEFSRMKSQSHGRFGKDNDKWGFNNTSTIRVTGRHMINIWRAMRSELNLLQYTMENVAFHLLHRRIPHFTWADLTNWYTNGKPRDLAKLINHYVYRVQLDLEILERNELIARTSEQARLLGVDFFSVFSRGSQFKVESLMFRIAKPENFMLVSPSRKQVGGQNALECLPLVMEPQSAFYNGPLLVLDFQSLYPSVMIAYNYCYSTFLGRVVNWRGANKMGFTEFKRQQRLLELLKDHINIAPNGMMYTKPEIRKSLLAKMLGEILETRVMVKSGMKVDKDDKALQRLLNNRQLALKLIANVTYGYTSASFSGRMPCSEIADSIVQTGRETLEKAIALIHSVKRWGAEVVYGDTDSLFVYLKGRTKDQAFDIGEEIAKTVTNMNPRPIKLKFEKVYLPCVLLAKKRYVGFKYEHRNQTEPEFDAKGIETVRRDGTPAEQKIEEKALKVLFRTADLSQVKSYFQKQCEKIMKGSVSIQDFCFAREVKLGTYSDKGPPPPGALISTKRMLEDARAEPQYGERIPYVVITGAPGARLIDRCVAPEELLENDHSELDAEYYISKNLIPPLERIFNLVGANVRNWYDEMPKYQRVRRVDANLQLQGQSKELAISKKTLESYMRSSSCLVCKEKLELEGSICPNCLSNMPRSLLSLRTRLNGEERRFMDIQKICQGCSGISPLDEVRCDSKDCPVFYTRIRQKARLKTERGIVEPVMKELSSLIVNMADLEW